MGGVHLSEVSTNRGFTVPDIDDMYLWLHSVAYKHYALREELLIHRGYPVFDIQVRQVIWEESTYFYQIFFVIDVFLFISMSVSVSVTILKNLMVL